MNSTLAEPKKKMRRDNENGNASTRTMLIYEYKAHGSKSQYAAIDEAIRIVQFIRNKCVRLWMDRRGTNQNELQCYCATLAGDYPFARRLNSQARQASASRAWCAISRFYENCQHHKPGKKGYPTFQHDNRSVEYKQTGWKLSPDGKHITFTDGCGIGTLRLVGNPRQQIEACPSKKLKRVRLVRRADGYFIQFGVEASRQIVHQPSGRQVGIDLGLLSYYTDSDGNTLPNPRFLRGAEKRLKRLHRHLSRKKKGSNNRKKARKDLAKGYLKVQRQREDFARKQASTLISSSDLIAYEDLKIRNMKRNRHFAKSIHDAGWGIFLRWVRYYGAIHGVPVLAVEAAWTSQECSRCGRMVKKSLSMRTHICPGCGLILDRDQNAARNILQKALQGTVGQTETSGLPENAWGEVTATALSAKTLQQAISLNQESPVL
jgi:putative transposase